MSKKKSLSDETIGELVKRVGDLTEGTDLDTCAYITMALKAGKQVIIVRRDNKLWWCTNDKPKR